MQAQHHTTIETTLHLRETLRAGPYAWPGGYPVFLLTSDGAALSFAAARAQYRQISWAIRHRDNTGGWRVVACEVNWEDPDLRCAHTEEKIPSAYAD